MSLTVTAGRLVMGRSQCLWWSRTGSLVQATDLELGRLFNEMNEEPKMGHRPAKT